jgi:hypothetical protein
MNEQTLDHKRLSIKSECEQIALPLNKEFQLKSDRDPWQDKHGRDSGMRQHVKALDNPILKVIMTIILCLMMPGTHRALPTCFKYPRYFVSNFTSNFILSMDMHFPTDLLIYVGHSNDAKLNGNTLCDDCAIPFVAAMSIADPTFKWTLAAVQWAW